MAQAMPRQCLGLLCDEAVTGPQLQPQLAQLELALRGEGRGEGGQYSQSQASNMLATPHNLLPLSSAT
jgi:hypothetical protein